MTLSSEQHPLFSFIIPVFHESTITSFLTQLKTIDDYDRCEVLVVDGSPTKDTIQKITDPLVRTLYSQPGRGQQMNKGAQQALGSILVFLHADTILPSNALALIEQTLQKKKCCAGAFQLRIDSPRFRYRILERCISIRGRITRIPFGDQAIFMTTIWYQKLGGYQNIPLMEDVELMRRLKQKGGRICILKETVTTSCRRWTQEGFVGCTLRNWFIRTLYYLGVHPDKLIKWYRRNHE